MVVGITENGHRRFFAHGRADSFDRHVDEGTLFEIGSVTKLFTALLLADMSTRGEIALDAPVADLLPAGTRVPERHGQVITLAQLVTHTSGLPRLPTNLEPSNPANPYGGYTAKHLYAFLASHQLARTPGEGFEYSNLGAGLLGYALALRAGLPYEDLVRTHILEPLGMRSTAIRLTPAMGERLASGHDDSGDPVSGWDLGVLAGAGALRSTAADLLIFVEALMDPDAMPFGPSVAILMASREAGGLAMSLPQPGRPAALQHEGGTGGYRSYAGCVPAWRRGAVVLANACTGAVADLGIHLVDARWAPHWHRQEAAVDPACFDRLLGRYRMTPDTHFDVMRVGDRLLVQLTDQPAFRVFPLSEWHVFYKVVGAQITFEPGPDGKAARLILHQNSCDRMAERVE
jgi:D-alanyl-D-alanine-carboxypeptidase/D-alanyl-D-alanine-endopeptidase